MNKKYIFMFGSLIIAIGLILAAVITNDDIVSYLMIFFCVGLGLALLRLLVNSAIKKMKGKSIWTKLLFFTVLLGFGLPFQNWFRKDVIFAMDSDYILRCIVITVMGVIFMTFLFGMLFSKKRQTQVEIVE
ncbi:MFS transporter permease [Psychrobacillus sp. Sa2BUA9]|uniref:MFS transporter permease n=1 Tax=Psychrobacillus faecigallinarum TaxID=2762235 RepID=A0ABR8RD52_9BACI|nr:MFS transporter permease [Psychrobacillus faecigallinarum]MBD7945605.1 MFS transporter permease [Psychrobacillus faecigallinarum]